ncbi:unnamed protein product [Leptosia nina]|uniref:MADF domain-containing protein n=1 Tax=Leptosia nina TaxID=320188 RepID=A0AAV1JLX1_9NEOP
MTNAQVIRLVNEFKARPLLWDPNHDLYRVQIAKYEAWTELAKLFGYDVSDMRKKFNSIFASHRREKGKVRTGKKSHWFLYNHLTFLPSHIENLDTTPTSKHRDGDEEHKEEYNEEEDDQDAEQENSSFTSTEFVQDEIEIKNEPEVHSPPKKVRMFRKRPLRTIRHIKRPKITRDRSVTDAVKIIKASSPAKRKDECDSFGEYIAVSLRKHDERTRSMIKQAINNILFEQEMKKYNSSVIVEMETNPLIIGDGDGNEYESEK